jgi:hypothetical protein
VGDEEVCELEVGLEVFEQVDDLGLDRDVERRHRLVADDEVRVEREGAGEADPLALTAGKLMRVPRGCIGREPDDLEQLAHTPRGVLLAGDAVHPQRLPHDPADAVPRIQRRVGILENHLHPPPERPELVLRERRDVLAVEDDAPSGRLVEPENGATDRRLAAARLADEAEGLAALDRERDVVHRLDVADVPVEQDAALDREPDAEVLDLDESAIPFAVARDLSQPRPPSTAAIPRPARD